MDGIEQMADNLTSLELRTTALPAIPDTISTLQKLAQLWIYAENLEHISDEVGDLSSLYALTFSGFPGEIPKTIGKLAGLNSLDIVKCSRASEVLDSVAKITNLQALNLKEIDLQEIPSWIASMPRLGYLGLSGNRITEIPSGILENLKNFVGKLPLNMLDISGTGIKMLPPSIKGLGNLATIAITTATTAEHGTDGNLGITELRVFFGSSLLES